MTKNILRHTLTALGLVWMFVAEAQHLSFNPTTKFRIESKVSFGSAMALGSNHGINSPVCIDINRSTSNDRYWYIYEFKTGKYAFRNASTGQYLVYDGVRSNSPIRRNLSLTNNVANDSALWTIGQSPAGYYYVQSVVAPTYCFNVRTGSYALGTFNEGGTPNNNNELFSIYKEDGTPYDPQKDYNTVCGRNDDGLYWAISDLEHPFVFTTDDSDPVYYYIKNSRSTLWIEPDQFLKQSADKPSKRFYFKEAKDGVQIMIEGGGFVSAELPQSNQTSATDVQTQSGRPNANDHIWNIAYHSNNGYSVGIEKCSKNSTYNPKIIGGQVYWNDYSQFGVCYYSVDEGSLFQFYSDDERHRNYLAGLGLVIPSDSIITPDKPDDPPVDPVTDGLESITGTLTHVYRADGKIDVIPAQYVANITRADSVIITTKNNGPRYAYASYEVDSVSACVPQDLPRFNSFKFNNKFNQHLISDAIGVFYGDSLITLNAVCIGKRLRPSFQVDDDVEVYVGDSLQLSKTTRTRYDHDVTYTIARHGQTVLRRTTKGKYVVYPYGRKTRVHVDFATDQATGDYGVPVIYINTDDGTAVNSKEYYWNAKMSIDGAGVFEDMPETAMQIKGRGNSSWTPTGKAPYHIKFETAVKPFGLRKGKHWNLIANAQSLSMTTNAIAMKMAQLVETAGFNHEIPCELYLNGQYRGSYNLTEKIGFSNNSIDIVDETNAVMLELDSYYDEVYKFRTQRYSLPVNIKEPDLTLGTSPLTSLLINQHFNRAITAMYNKGDMSQYFDLDYLARFLFVDEYAFNTEFMHPKSTFLYNENILNSDCKYIFGPVWDFDWGYGYQLRGNYFSIQPTLDFWSSVNMTATSWVRDLRYCGTNLDKEYYRLWHNFMTNGSLDELVEFCQDYYDFAKASFTHNNVRWGGGDANSYAALTSNAQTWLRSRAQYIYDYLSKGLGYANLGYLDNYPAPNLIGDVNNDGVITTADII